MGFKLFDHFKNIFNSLMKYIIYLGSKFRKKLTIQQLLAGLALSKMDMVINNYHNFNLLDF